MRLQIRLQSCRAVAVLQQYKHSDGNTMHRAEKCQPITTAGSKFIYKYLYRACFMHARRVHLGKCSWVILFTHSLFCRYWCALFVCVNHFRIQLQTIRRIDRTVHCSLVPNDHEQFSYIYFFFWRLYFVKFDTTSVLARTTDAMEGASPNVSQQAEKDYRKQEVERCIKSLVHASQCRVVACGELQCQKMKRIVGHAKECKRKKNGGCAICKHFIALCCYHAKRCQQVRCPILYCSAIKAKLQQRFAYVKHVRLCCNHLPLV